MEAGVINGATEAPEVANSKARTGEAITETQLNKRPQPGPSNDIIWNNRGQGKPVKASVTNRSSRATKKATKEVAGRSTTSGGWLDPTAGTDSSPFPLGVLTGASQDPNTTQDSPERGISVMDSGDDPKLVASGVPQGGNNKVGSRSEAQAKR